MVREWLEDELHALMGFAERALTDYILAVAKRSRSVEELRAKLEDQGLPPGQKTSTLAEALYQRVNGASTSGQEAAAARERQAADQAKRSATKYALVTDQADEEERRAGEGSISRRRHRRGKEGKGSRVEDAGTSSRGAEDSGTTSHFSQKKRRKWEEDQDMTEEELEAKRQSEARLRDQQEKAEFEERLRARDEERTRRMAEASTSGGPQSEIDKIVERVYAKSEGGGGGKDKTKLMPTLREVSRQEYLKKREAQKLKELKESIEDELFLFKDVKLTKKEQKEYDYKKRVYELATERIKEIDAVNEYRIPDAYTNEEGKEQTRDERYAAALERYKDKVDKDDANPFKEQDAWEAHQSKHAKLSTGAEAGRREEGQSYDFVFEDQVEFIKEDLMTGNLDLLEEDEGEREAKLRDLEEKSERERMKAVRASLPIYQYRESLLSAIQEYQILIIVGETGSGKSTQIPQYLHEEGFSKLGKIGCTQPRRVAAMSVAARVAEEMAVKLGNEVGYSIRFEDCTSEKTIVKYMTDGMLMREFLGEPDLASYSVMIIDEAHERTLQTDVLFGLVKDIARYRNDIKLLISSATLDAEKFSEYFDYAPIFRIPGRRYPVDIMYTKAPEADYMDAAVVTTLQIHVTQPPGDVLIFFTGQEEIETCEEILRQRTRSMGSKISEMIICPIYANLPSQLQAKIFEPTPEGARKVVIATNIAETSLTIDGIRYVIDPGFAKQNSFNPRTGMESLIVTPVSKAAAMQRTGRAGRTGPGQCFRLYTAWSFQHELEDNTIPEIQRTNLGNVVLMLKSLGINDLMNFDFMDPPPAETLLRALEQLYALGALNDKGELTKLGRKMAEFPLDPMLAKAMVASDAHGVSEEVITICAMLTCGGSVFYRPKDKQVHADNAHNNFHRGNVGDHVALLQVYNTWRDSGHSTQWCYENFVQIRELKRARDIRDQLVGLMERVEIELRSDAQAFENIKKSITSGYFYHTAQLQRNGSYKTVKNPQTVHIHPSSGLRESLPRWVVYHELVLTSKEYMRNVTEIRPDWLVEIAPHYYNNASDLVGGGGGGHNKK
ncbi:P-loop-containing nucleoside triphosphate hydrolase [Chloropicon primus]|nr:P-loop-containing nucleoside triphosphate hydrolase [Chloropicon primus]